MGQDIRENGQEPSEGNQEEHPEQTKEKKDWKDIINLPDDLDHEVH